MAKIKVKFCCTECGHEAPKWLGRCPGCGAWNTMVEEAMTAKSDTRLRYVEKSKPRLITEVDNQQYPAEALVLMNLTAFWVAVLSQEHCCSSAVILV